jgi:hypothetical protein
MREYTDTLLGQAIALAPAERAMLVEGIIQSLDRPDPALDALWLAEAQDRLAAYGAGDMDAIDANRFFLNFI